MSGNVVLEAGPELVRFTVAVEPVIIVDDKIVDVMFTFEGAMKRSGRDGIANVEDDVSFETFCGTSWEMYTNGSTG